MCITAAILGGAAISGVAANKASKTQAGAANKSLAVQERIYGQQRQDLQPFQQAGVNALRQYAGEFSGGFQEQPGYQFGLQQGTDAVEASAAARGGLFSGATGAALNQFGQDYANTRYDNYLNRLQGLSNMGQSAAAMQGAAGQNYATGASNSLAGLGNAQSAGAIGVGNALQGGLNNLIGYQMFNKLGA